MADPRKDELVAALRDAASAHHDYQTNFLNGQYDMHWPGWYAAYVLGRVGNFTSPSELSYLLDSVDSDYWTDAAADAILKRRQNTKE